MGTTSNIAFPLAINPAYFCLIDVVSLCNLLAAIKMFDNTVALHPSKRRCYQIN